MMAQPPQPHFPLTSYGPVFAAPPPTMPLGYPPVAPAPATTPTATAPVAAIESPQAAGSLAGVPQPQDLDLLFSMLDRDGDGSITREDLAWAAQRYGYSGSAAAAGGGSVAGVSGLTGCGASQAAALKVEAYRGVRAFPYHDPAYGCHFREHSMNDSWDDALRNLQPDKEPPFERLFVRAKAALEQHEAQKRNRRKLQRLEEQALEKLHMDWVRSGYDEVAAPAPLHPHLADTEFQAATVNLYPEPEERSLLYWLA
eukprot:TRINITY_DN21401_c0_g1_i1.p1 TRINITY_DN21401_c0_g1~~TRINITY_DN21401_c0_g1_i1.p1  ORF type:complete len:256 (+),score=46.94 TRINITY_DN21401_c0_g1_i1:91-858(+)